MVCGRVKRTNARKKCRTASSGVASHLRPSNRRVRRSVQTHAAARAAQASSRTRCRWAATGTCRRWQRRLWTHTRVASGCPRGASGSVSTAGLHRSEATQHAVSCARSSPGCVARRRKRGEEARRARGLRTRKDGNCCGAAAWSTREPEALALQRTALRKARTTAAGLLRRHRARDHRPRRRRPSRATVVPALCRGAQHARCRRHRRLAQRCSSKVPEGGRGFAGLASATSRRRLGPCSRRVERRCDAHRFAPRRCRYVVQLDMASAATVAAAELCGTAALRCAVLAVLVAPVPDAAT